MPWQRTRKSHPDGIPRSSRRPGRPRHATLGEQLRAQNAQLTAEKTRMDLTDLRFKHGASNAFDVLDAQRSLFAAQQAAVHVQAQQLQNLVTLYKVLGGGWK